MSDQFKAACLSGDIKTAEMIDLPDNFPIHTLFCDVCKINKLNVAKWIYETYKYNRYFQINRIKTIELSFKIACLKNYLDLAKWLFSILPNFILLRKLFKTACEDGYLEMAKWMYDIDPKLPVKSENFMASRLFNEACYNRFIDLAKWLFSINPNIDLSYDSNSVFIYACSSGNLEFAEWIFDNHPNIIESYQFYWSFISACRKKNLDTAQWLLKIHPSFDIYTRNHSILNVAVFSNIEIVEWLLSVAYKSHSFIDFYNYSSIHPKIKDLLIKADLVDPSNLSRNDLEYYLSITDRFVPQNFKTEFTDIPVKRRGDHTKPALH